MAIVQISQITNRKGLAENLPQLAGAEFGWSTDTRQLWIGNGTLEDGAPVVGNTEILTEFSDILNFTTTYTYKGQAAGYTVQTGATPGTPVTQSLQSWLDQFATVKDFGAVGDGVTDDTAAINRALYQLFCRESNPQVRRSLFFPAGVYRVTGSINIPPYATLYGEGLNNSIISMDPSVATYVARTADSSQQTGANIGSGGATPPAFITISNMCFQNLNATANTFLVQDATDCHFQNVSFTGALTTSSLTSASANIMGVEFASTISYVCDQIVFDSCKFSGTTWASYSDQQMKGIVFSNSKLDTLYRGFEFGTGTVVNGGATGVRIVHNLFDNIYAEGIIFGTVNLNASGYNIFYNVGNHTFTGAITPATSIINILSDNNVSVGDMFARSNADAAVYPRINTNNTVSIATTNGSQLVMGTYTRQSGLQATIVNNTSAPLFTVDTSQATAFTVNYTIIRGTSHRTGTILVSSNSGSPTTSDDYVQNSDTGITLSATQTGTTVSVNYSSANLGTNSTINYSVTYLI